MPPPRPAGYAGVNHETIGTDILAAQRAIHLPDMVLGPALSERLRAVKPDAWYPIDLLLDVLDKVEASMGGIGLKQFGRRLFDLSHKAVFLQHAKCAADLIYGADAMYRAANRGEQIGGWRVVAFSPGHAVMEKATPHHCFMEEGIFAEALTALGVPASLSQSACVRRGAPACHFELSSMVQDARWGKAR